MFVLQGMCLIQVMIPILLFWSDSSELIAQDSQADKCVREVPHVVSIIIFVEVSCSSHDINEFVFLDSWYLDVSELFAQAFSADKCVGEVPHVVCIFRWSCVDILFFLSCFTEY